MQAAQLSCKSAFGTRPRVAVQTPRVQVRGCVGLCVAWDTASASCAVSYPHACADPESRCCSLQRLRVQALTLERLSAEQQAFLDRKRNETSRSPAPAPTRVSADAGGGSSYMPCWLPCTPSRALRSPTPPCVCVAGPQLDPSSPNQQCPFRPPLIFVLQQLPSSLCQRPERRAAGIPGAPPQREPPRCQRPYPRTQLGAPHPRAPHQPRPGRSPGCQLSFILQPTLVHPLWWPER
jgi:hypothetical protein